MSCNTTESIYQMYGIVIPPSEMPQAANATVESPELSGYIDSIYALLSGTFGTLDKSSNPPNQQTQLIMQLFAKIINSPNFMNDLKAGAAAGSAADTKLLAALTNTDAQDPVSVQTMCANGDFNDLYIALTHNASGAESLLNQSFDILTQDYPSSSMSYNYPGTQADYNKMMLAFKNLENSLSDDLSQLQIYLGEGDTTDALEEAKLIGNQLEALSTAAADNPNDGFSLMITSLLNAPIGDAGMTLQQFATDFNSSVANPDISKLYNPANPNDKTTGIYLLNFPDGVNILSILKNLSGYCMQWCYPPKS